MRRVTTQTATTTSIRNTVTS